MVTSTRKTLTAFVRMLGDSIGRVPIAWPMALLCLLFCGLGIRAQAQGASLELSSELSSSLTAEAPVAPLQLAPGLQVPLPDSLELAVFEPGDLPASLALGSPVLVGKLNAAPGYFIAATQVKTWEKNAVLWRRLESEIGKRSKGEFNLRQRGNFTTDHAGRVWFRHYEYRTAGQRQQQVFFLLKGSRRVYWLSLTTLEGSDTGKVIPLAQALLRRAQIVSE